MDLLEIHRRIRLALNKDTTGYLSPEEIDRSLDRAQLMEIRHLYGDDRRLPNSPLAYGMTLKIHADLTPFKKAANFQPNSGPPGVLVFPSDYLFPIALTVLHDNIPRTVKIVSEDEIGIRLSSVLRSPSVSRPIAIIGGTFDETLLIAPKGIAQLFPESQYNATLYYLKRPNAPELKGTVNGRVFTYDRASTVQLEWPDTAIDRIIERAISILSENLQEGEIGNNNYNKAQQ